MPSAPPPARRAARDGAQRARHAPARQLAVWIRAAHRAGVHEPEAMCLATSGTAGRASARMVLLRGLEPDGLIFFTNYRSRKGREVERRPYAAVVFYWPAIGRQVRIEGRVRRLSVSESDDYFASRPREARLAAWASDQSSRLRSRAVLLARFAAVRARYRGRDVPRPPHWGGFRLVPTSFEFWRSRPHRLHERKLFERRRGGWGVALLAP